MIDDHRAGGSRRQRQLANLRRDADVDGLRHLVGPERTRTEAGTASKCRIVPEQPRGERELAYELLRCRTTQAVDLAHCGRTAEDGKQHNLYSPSFHQSPSPESSGSGAAGVSSISVSPSQMRLELHVQLQHSLVRLTVAACACDQHL